MEIFKPSNGWVNEPVKERPTSYQEYIKSDHWHELRAMALAHYGRRCKICFEEKEFVHVHHIRYGNFYNCTVKDLKIVCPECHKDVHGLNKLGNNGMALTRRVTLKIKNQKAKLKPVKPYHKKPNPNKKWWRK
jgi:hypothetical protein